jgi:hypothetical protein
MTKAVLDPFEEESGIHKKQIVARPVNRNWTAAQVSTSPQELPIAKAKGHLTRATIIT